MQRRTFCLAALSAATAAHAADPFPSKPVRIIVAFAAGGGPDIQARQLAPRFGDALGQPIVVENKVGAAGVLAAQFTAQQPADGYTVLMAASTHLVLKAMQPDLKFDMLADFAPVGLIGSSPTVMMVPADSPYKKVEDVIAAARANPGKLNYSSGGIGTAAHLAGATLVSLAALKATHIPLKGSVEIPASLLRGDTDFAFPIAGTAVPQVKSGKFRALAVTSQARFRELPDVPTLQEVMKSDLAVQESWFGFVAPARTPADVVAKLHAATAKALGDGPLRAAFEASGNTPQTSASPQAFTAFMQSENRKWAEIVKLSGITPT